MLILTQGIVLRAINYSESSIIATIYTRQFGLKSYIVKGVNAAKNKKSKHNFFQPLSLIEIVVYNKPTKNLQHIKEIKPFYMYKTIPLDPIKTSIFLFLHEVLYKSIKEEDESEQLFLFITNSLIELDTIDQNISNFHLNFLLNLSQLLGFAPLNNYSEYLSRFNLSEGSFQHTIPEHQSALSIELSSIFSQLLKSAKGKVEQPHLTYAIRKQLLLKFIEYYQLHLTGFRGIQSHKILEEILR